MKTAHIDSVLIIGAGKVGQSIADFLIFMGINNFIYTHNYYKNNEEKYKDSYLIELDDLKKVPELTFICVNDYSISEASIKFAEHFKYDLKDKVVVHTSGIKCSEELLECQKYGAFTASFHPYQTFPSVDKDLLNGIYWGLETDFDKRIFEKVFSRLGFNYQKISRENKRLYHLSACILSNYLVGLLDAGSAALKSAGGDFEKFALPIISKTIENYTSFGGASLTGPIARGDKETVVAHLDALKDKPELLKAYSLLGLLSIDRATEFFTENVSVYKEINDLLTKNV